jgi:hypothetical protein
MYALNLAEDGRILSATYPQYAPADAVIVDTLPEGNLPDYRYVDGEYVYAPKPKPSNLPVAPRNVTEGEYITVNGVLYKITANIPSGEPIITGQNAIETTIEQQLAELAKGE